MTTKPAWTILSSVESAPHFRSGTAEFNPELIWLDIKQRARRCFGRAEFLRCWREGTLGLIGLEHPEVGDMIAIGEEELRRTVRNCPHMVVDAHGSLVITAEANAVPAPTPWRVSERERRRMRP